MILQVHRDFFNSETGAAGAEKAQVLRLDGLKSPQGTLGLFIRKRTVVTPEPRPRSYPMFLLITRIATWLRLSRREETQKTAEFLVLRH